MRMELADLVSKVRKSVVRLVVSGSQGSGVVVADDRIVTNAHVVHGSWHVKVVDDGGGERNGRVILRDPQRDLAVVATRCTDLPQLETADRGHLRDGDDVFALGFPLGLDLTVTKGIVSARSRRYNGQEFIQTDAAISPGNSGGALINGHGLLVGINTFLLTGGHSLNFAIPADEASRVAFSTIAGGGEDMISCPSCAAATPITDRYCSNCGSAIGDIGPGLPKPAKLPSRTVEAATSAPLPSTGVADAQSCAACGQLVLASERYCPHCGTSRWRNEQWLR